MKNIGVVDIGSNSMRLVVASVDKDNEHFKILDELKESLRLGKAIGRDGNLAESKIEELLFALKGYKSLAESLSVEKLKIVATAALRASKNSREIVARIKSELDLDVEIISGQMEAYYDYFGTINSMDISDALLVDIGGASTELIHVRDRELLNSISIPFGALNITEKFKIQGKLESEKSVKKFLNKIFDDIDWLKDVQGVPLVGIGGTFRNLAKIDRKMTRYPLDMNHNYEICSSNFKNILSLLKNSTKKDRFNIKGLSENREDIIVGASLIAESVFDYNDLSTVLISGYGLREGCIFSDLFKDKRLDDVLDYELRRILKRYELNETHAFHVLKLFNSLFEKLYPIHGLKRENLYSIIKTAVLLHDIGISINYYDHNKHSLYILMNSGIKGLSHREIIIASLVAGLHRKDGLKLSRYQFSSILSDCDIRTAKYLGMILLICEMLDRRLDGSIEDVEIAIGAECVNLKLITALENLAFEKSNIDWISEDFKSVFGKSLHLEF